MTTQQVRTDYILSNVFATFKKFYYPVKIAVLDPSNTKERNALEHVLNLCIHIYSKYYFSICKLTHDIIPVKKDKFEALWYELYNQLFNNCISWSRILMFISITARLMAFCEFNDIVFKYFSNIIKEKLLPWIENHDGWEAMKIDEKLNPFPKIKLKI